MIQYKQYIALCSCLLLLLPIASVHAERLLPSDQLNLSISTDKRVYYLRDIAVYTVKFTDSQGNLIDPDLIRATYDSQFIDLDNLNDGVYIHTTERLTQRDHQLGVYAEKAGYNFVQESLTIRPVAAQNADGIAKATAVQQGSLLKFRLSNDMQSRSEIYKVRVITPGASLDSVVSSSWIKVQNHVGVDLKSVDGSIGPGEKQTIKFLVRGAASKVIWNAFDIAGNQIYSGVKNVAR